MVKKKKNITIIVIIIISVVIVGGVLTWGFLTNWGQGKKSEPVKYTVTKKIPKGNKIEIENPESLGFKIGQEIEIGTGESRERRTIVGFGSLILDRPLTKDYPENTEITVILEPIKKDFKVDHCDKYSRDLTCEKCRESHYLEDNKCKKYSYTGTKDDCNKNKGIFTKGTSSSDQTCVKCGKEQWVDISNGKQVCTNYTTQTNCTDEGKWFDSSNKGPTSDATCYDYANTENDCKSSDRNILTAGTSPTSDNSKCTPCLPSQYVTNDQCTNYTTQKNCTDKGKWFDSSTKRSTSDATCQNYTNDLTSCDDGKWLFKNPTKNQRACYDVVETREELEKLLNTPANGGYRMSSNEYILGNKNYGPIRTWRLGEDVTNLSRLFLKTNFNGDISEWDVSNVTNMSGMFHYARKFNGDLSKWNVSNVGDMNGMFNGAYKFNGDLSKWNVSNVTNMSSMFYVLDSNSSFNGDLSKWNVSNVTDMSDMFYGAPSFDGDLSKWNVSKVTNMTKMFSGASSFNRELSKWNVSKVAKMTDMFRNAQSFNGDLSKWNVSEVTNMYGMFGGASSFNGDLSGWNVSNVTNMGFMFDDAKNFNGDLSKWNVSKVTNMYGMFSNAQKFNQPLNDWDISGETSTTKMFDDSGMKICNKPDQTPCS